MKEVVVLKLRQSFKGVQALLTLLIHQINVTLEIRQEKRAMRKMAKWSSFPRASKMGKI